MPFLKDDEGLEGTLLGRGMPLESALLASQTAGSYCGTSTRCRSHLDDGESDMEYEVEPSSHGAVLVGDGGVDIPRPRMPVLSLTGFPELSTECYNTHRQGLRLAWPPSFGGYCTLTSSLPGRA